VDFAACSACLLAEMEDASSVDVILDFLQKNGFSRAEAALRSELSGRPDTNGFQKLCLEEKVRGKKVQEDNVEKREKLAVRDQEFSSQHSNDASKELIVKEIECRTVRNGKANKWKSGVSTAERNTSVGAGGVSNENFSFSRASEDTVLDLCNWKYNQPNGSSDPFHTGSNTVNMSPLEFQSTGPSKICVPDAGNTAKVHVRPNDGSDFSGEKRLSLVLNASKANADTKTNKIGELQGIEERRRSNIPQSADETWSRNEEASSSSSIQRKDCIVKTVLSFSGIDIPTTSDNAFGSSWKEGSRKPDLADVRSAIKEQVDEVGRSLYLAKLQGSCDTKNLDDLGLTLAEIQKEELPRLPPVKLKSDDKLLSANWVDRFDHDGLSLKLGGADNSHLIGSYLDVPVGQEINASGMYFIMTDKWILICMLPI